MPRAWGKLRGRGLRGSRVDENPGPLFPHRTRLDARAREASPPRTAGAAQGRRETAQSDARSISAAVGSEAAFIQPDPSVTNTLSFEICAGSLWRLGATTGNRLRNFFHHQHPCVGGEKDFLFNSQCLLHRFVCKTGRQSGTSKESARFCLT